jgi:hypothetical protein
MKRFRLRYVPDRLPDCINPKTLEKLRVSEGKGERLDSFRTCLFLLAFAHNGGTKPGSKVVRKGVKLRIPVDLNGLLRGVTNNVTVVAPGQVIF